MKEKFMYSGCHVAVIRRILVAAIAIYRKKEHTFRKRRGGRRMTVQEAMKREKFDLALKFFYTVFMRYSNSVWIRS